MAGSTKQQVLSQRALAAVRSLEATFGRYPLVFLFRSQHANRPTPPRLHNNMTTRTVDGEDVRVTRGERKRLARAGAVWAIQNGGGL